MTYKNTALTFILITMLGLALWTNLLSFKHEPPMSHHAKTSLPDAYMEDVTATVMDKQGKVKMKILTPKMLHYNENDLSKLVKPEISLYRKSAWPWHITAKTAVASQGIAQVDFWDNVVIHHPADESNPATLIKTSTLRVLPDKQVATTDDVITMNQPNLNITAMGMIADMDKGIIRLLSSARGEYAPTS